MIASFALLSECDTSRTTGKGYQKIGQDVQEGCEDGDEDDPAEEEEASDDDSGSQESDTDDESDYESDSECCERKLIYQTGLWAKLWTVSIRSAEFVSVSMTKHHLCRFNSQFMIGVDAHLSYENLLCCIFEFSLNESR